MKPKRSHAHRLPLYTAAATAAVSSVHGQVVYFDSSHAFTVSQAHPFANWDIDGGGTNDFQFSIYYGNTTIRAYAINNGNRWLRNTTNFAVKVLPPSYQVGSGLDPARFILAYVNFVNPGGLANDVSEGAQFLGFKFNLSGQTDYGWAKITIATGPSPSVTINEWAYAANGAAITTLPATVPEPADAALGLGLLALGAAGVSAYKRRK